MHGTVLKTAPPPHAQDPAEPHGTDGSVADVDADDQQAVHDLLKRATELVSLLLYA